MMAMQILNRQCQESHWWINDLIQPARQAAITQEITEIVAGASALE